jgi:hypothetical protein
MSLQTLKRPFDLNEDEALPDEGNTPPRKRAKSVLETNSTDSFHCTLRVTNRTNTEHCSLKFIPRTSDSIKNLKESVRERLIECDTPCISMVDLASADNLLLYRDTTSLNFFSHIPYFLVEGHDDNSKFIISFLKGLLTRNDEIIVSPIEGTDQQMLIFWETPYEEASIEDEDWVPSSMSAIIINRYTMALDLDGTLISARSASEHDKPKPNEEEFFCKGGRFICNTRPGVDMLLRWASSLFKIVICTNAIYDYAVEVAKLLDPHKEHLLKSVTDVQTIIRSREDMIPVKHIKAGGLKDLNNFGIDPFECVIFDDSSQVWKNIECLLPFSVINEKKKPSEYLVTLRKQVWIKFAFLHRKKFELRRKQKTLMRLSKKSFSQEHILCQIGAPHTRAN